ncbi:CAP domain-containing protein [Strongyloides ratti]|uniref:CAP domain-containing protein n=1 Tax=Strongyloides ratti TaxID=34506 RepID=A0A090L9X3_STRRB|nr:CAP domain-containing protein [Strongyloides ratti]CEF66576.2 CAP domain-containing protein [Strongyloides ratti]
MIFIFYITIFFSIFIYSLQLNIHFLVAYTLKLIGRTNYFIYRGHNYGDLSHMLAGIKSNHPEVNKTLLLFQLKGISANQKFKHFTNKYQKLKGTKLEDYILKKDDVVLEKYSHRNKILYVCNKNTFQSYKQLLQYVKELQLYSTFQIPERLLGTNLLSNKIWHKVWDGCNYQCFSQREFDLMKLKFLLELNLYRRLSSLTQLIMNRKLSDLAQKSSVMLSKLKLITLSAIKNSELHDSMSIGTSPLLFKRWFDKSKSNENSKISRLTNKYSILLQKKWSMIGIGVTKKENKLYIVVIFK